MDSLSYNHYHHYESQKIITNISSYYTAISQNLKYLSIPPISSRSHSQSFKYAQSKDAQPYSQKSPKIYL